MGGWRVTTVAIMLAAATLAACGGGSENGFVTIASDDTEGAEWTLYAEARDGRWTGCLRYDDGDHNIKRCDDPGSLVQYVEPDEIVRFGAAPKGAKLEVADADEGGKIFRLHTYTNEAISDYEFFGIKNTDEKVVVRG